MRSVRAYVTKWLGKIEPARSGLHSFSACPTSSSLEPPRAATDDGGQYLDSGAPFILHDHDGLPDALRAGRAFVMSSQWRSLEVGGAGLSACVWRAGGMGMGELHEERSSLPHTSTRTPLF